MNIFVLSYDPIICAHYHCDVHVRKMIVESAQMLANGYPLEALQDAPLTQKGLPRKHSFLHHPCAKWVLRSRFNWDWLLELAKELCAEHRYRFNKSHFTQTFIDWCDNDKCEINNVGVTPFARAMPDKYNYGDAESAYRRYYIGEKSFIANWTKRQVPEWFGVNHV